MWSQICGNANCAIGTPNVLAQVPDTTPGALRALLRYLYTDELSFSDDVVLDVMLLAQKMLLPRVQQHCLLHTREGLSPTNAVDWLIWAEEHSGHEQLRSAAFTFLSTHFRDVRKRREQLSVLVTRRPDLVVELLAAL
jgi:BTB/POZ domain